MDFMADINNLRKPHYVCKAHIFCNAKIGCQQIAKRNIEEEKTR